MGSHTHRPSKYLGASAAAVILSLGGLTASISALSKNEPISGKDAFRRSTTTVARTYPVCTGDARGGNDCPPRVKNGVLRSTTTNVPQTIAVCQGGGKNCNKPKRNP